MFLPTLVAAAWWAPSVAQATPGWYSVIPPVLAVTLALVTRRIYFSLAAAVCVGGLLVAWQAQGGLAAVAGGLGLAARFVVGTLLEPASGRFNATNLLILAYVVFIMVSIAVMVAAGGLHALADRLERWARSPRSTQLAAYFAGLIVFIDDYANTMIVGSTFGTISDRHRVSRPKLAFLVDATAAPVAGLALVSTWIGYEVGLLGEVARSLGITKGGYELFLAAIGFRYYCITMLGFVLLNIVFGLDFGPMAAAEAEARRGRSAEPATAQAGTHGGVAAAEPDEAFAAGASRSTEPPICTAQGASDWGDCTPNSAPADLACQTPWASREPIRKSVWTALLPLAVLLGTFLGGLWVAGGGAGLWAHDAMAPLRLSAWREVLSVADSIMLLALASAAALLAAVLMARCVARLSVAGVCRAIAGGARAALLPVTVLILAWALKRACDTLATGPYLAQLLAAGMWPPVFPMLVFLVACGCSLATGTSWGTMAILLPTALPVAFQLDGAGLGTVTTVTIAAVLDGAIFGDHCSPISDTTIMSAAAAGCSQVAHVQTQLPYAFVVALIASVVAYFPAGLGAANWVGMLGAMLLVVLLFSTLRLARRRSLP